MRHGTAQHKELSALPAPEPLPVQDAEEVTQFAEIDSEESLVILLVEDNNDVASYVSSILTETKVHFARNGKEGLEKAYSVVPDIIITDIMMPVMDGIELCKEIRKSDILNHIPIVVLSAKSTERDKLECLRAGADSYI
jgi:CheY-like chemotaxis protein